MPGDDRSKRRKDLSASILQKNARRILSANSATSRNYFFLHQSMNFRRLTGGLIDPSKGLDLNDPMQLAYAIEMETKRLDVFPIYLNILRHLLLIPTDEELGVKIWTLMELFIHRAVLPADDDDDIDEDVAKLDAEHFSRHFDSRDSGDKKDREEYLANLMESLKILFPRLVQGGGAWDMNFAAGPDGESGGGGGGRGGKKETEEEGGGTLPGESPFEGGADGDIEATDLGEDYPDAEVVTVGKDQVVQFMLPDSVATSSSAEIVLNEDGIPVAPSGGPPPPPGGAGGPPPPPPPPAERVKPTMKRFNWEKIPERFVAETIFKEINTQKKTPIDGETLEKRFFLKKAKTTINVAAKKETRLIDPKRAQNVAILLTVLKKSNPAIKKAILDMDSSVLNLDNTKSLLRMIPSEEEEDKLRKYKGEFSQLGKPEQFYSTLIDIPLLKERLECFVFRKEFDAKVDELFKDINSVTMAMNEVVRSKKLRKIMEVTLSVGNHLNKGYYGKSGGDAKGFTLESLTKLPDTKSTDNTFTLMQYMVHLLEKRVPDCLKVEEDMPSISKASKDHVSMIREEAKEISTQFTAVGNTLKIYAQNVPDVSQDKFMLTMTKFYDEAEIRATALAKTSADIQNNFAKLAKFLGEFDDAADPTSILMKFCRLFKDGYAENLRQAEVQRDVIRKEAQKKKMQDILMRQRASKAGGGKSGAPPTEGNLANLQLKSVPTKDELLKSMPKLPGEKSKSDSKKKHSHHRSHHKSRK